MTFRIEGVIMRQMQVCSQGHRWDPVADGRADEHARWSICPICGSSVEMISLRDTSGSGSTPAPEDDKQLDHPPAADPGVPGYEVLGILGYGGMGVVYKARQVALNRQVALKMLSAGLRARSLDLVRFQREAHAAARLSHPHIVQVLDVGEHNGMPYVAMEFMDRGSLADAIEGNPLPPRVIAELIELLARAVQTAHDGGIIHRDLKPANILLTSPPSSLDPSQPGYTTFQVLGVPKIADFGLAKRIDEQVGQTRTGAVLGTPCYMAPEQAMGKGREVGPQADVYSLGTILYECLAGQPPFRAPTMLETLDLVRSQDPVPPSQLRQGISRELETICLKCLEKSPSARYPTAVELANDLRRYLDGQSIVARPTPAWYRPLRWLKRNAMASILLVLALTSLVLATSLLRRDPNTTPPLPSEDPDAVSIAYYRNFVKVRGVPRGIGRLSENEAARRHLSFRFHYRGKQVEKVEAVDRRGRPTVRHTITTHLSPVEGMARTNVALQNLPANVFSNRGRTRFTAIAGLLPPGVSCTWEYQRDDRGNLTKEIARDVLGRIVWTFQFTSPNTGHYTDERGFVLSRAGSGASYVQLTYDDNGLEKEVRYLGRTGKPRPDVSGIFGQRFEHDRNGLIRSVSFLGPRDNLQLHPLGYARITRTWDDLGQLLEEAYYDLRGKPARGMFARGTRICWTYDQDGNPTSQKTFGLDGKLLAGSFEMSYDERGNLKSYENLAPSSGQATGLPTRMLFDYDVRDNCTRIRYVDKDGNPAVNSASGAYALAMTHDTQGQVTSISYLGKDGQPAEAAPNPRGGPPRSGSKVVRLTLEYNERGQVINECLFGRENKLVADSAGVARSSYHYDEAGRRTEVELFGPDDKPLPPSLGFARRTWKYDELGRIEETCTYQDDGKLASLPEEDEDIPAQPSLSNLFRFWRFSRQISFPAGRLTLEYDDRGNLVRVSLFGEGDMPMGDAFDVACVQAKYDDLGNLSEHLTLDEQGLPKEVEGIARSTWAYDSFGNMTEVATYDARNRLVASRFGVARQTRRFDDHFNLIEEAFFGPDDQPTLGSFGYASARFRYDSDDNLLDSTYFGLDGKPVKTQVVWLYESTRLSGPPGPENQLRPGDVILTYDGEELRCARMFDLQKRREGQEGEAKEVRILRKGKVLTLRIPAGAFRREDYFDRGERRGRFERVFVPGGLDPFLFIQTRGVTQLASTRN